MSDRSYVEKENEKDKMWHQVVISPLQSECFAESKSLVSINVPSHSERFHNLLNACDEAKNLTDDSCCVGGLAVENEICHSKIEIFDPELLDPPGNDQRHENANVKNFTCRICNQVFDKSLSREALDEHVSMCATSVEIKARFEELDKHLRPVSTSFNCNRCPFFDL